MADAETLPVLMARVLGDLPAIGKDDRAPQNMGGYAFRGIESITAALKPLLAKHGVFVVPRTVERLESARPTKGGGTMFVIDVHVEWTFHGPAGDQLSASTWGEGTDSGDKATQKAYTSAFKSMLAQVFCISDSETDSERHEVPETTTVQYATAESVTALVERAKNELNDQQRDTLKQLMAQQGLSFTQKLTADQLASVTKWVDEFSTDSDRAPEPVTPVADPPSPPEGATGESSGGSGVNGKPTAAASETPQEKIDRLAQKATQPAQQELPRNDLG